MSAPHRILVADDEPYLVRILAYLLSKQGYEVRAAEDGETAYNLARTFQPDLLILDVMMPKLDGYELCRRIRAEEGSARSFVMLLSARGQSADRDTGLAAGADEYITKPFATHDLLEHVREVLAARDEGRSAA